MDTKIKHRVIEPKTKGELWIWADRQLTPPGSFRSGINLPIGQEWKTAQKRRTNSI
jgi:hypothetical protein